MKYTLLLLILAACSKPAMSHLSTDNPEITVEKLFTVDGCTVYRFDDSNTHYFVKCTTPSSVESTSMRGKVRVVDTITSNNQ